MFYYKETVRVPLQLLTPRNICKMNPARCFEMYDVSA